MRILFITGTYPPSINGVAVSVKNLKDKLTGRGHKVLVLAPKNRSGSAPDKDVLYYPSTENPVHKDYPVPLIPVTYKNYWAIKKFRPDIIHVHHPFHIGYAAYLLAKKLKRPLVFTYHTKYNYYAKKYFDFLPKKLKTDFIQNNVKDFCNKTNLVILPSLSMKHELKRQGIKTPMVAIPTIPDDLVNSGRPKGEIRRELKLPADKTILLCVGRLSIEKNLELLIKSMKFLSNRFILIICGSGPDEKNLKLMSRKTGLQKRVIFAGKVGRTKLSKYYEASDCLYFASVSETQGVVFWEAASFGLPIVSLETEVSKEWVKSSFGILSGPGVRDLAGAIKKITGKDYSELSKNAFRFSKKFSGDKFADNILKSYQKLVPD